MKIFLTDREKKVLKKKWKKRFSEYLDEIDFEVGDKIQFELKVDIKKSW
jgi:hypothetical protein